MIFLKKGNWGLRILALALAIVIYHTLKSGSPSNDRNHDRTIFQPR